MKTGMFWVALLITMVGMLAGAMTLSQRPTPDKKGLDELAPGVASQDQRTKADAHAGEFPVAVAEILGHTDTRMTKRYSHGMQERKREALEKRVSFSPRQRDAKNVKKEKRQGAHPAVVIDSIGGAEGGRTPDLRIAN
jgi:hypothetical protein